MRFLGLSMFLGLSGLLTWAASRYVLPIRAYYRVLLVLVAFVLPARALLFDRVLAPIDAPYRFAPLDEKRLSEGMEPRSSGILNDVYTVVIPWRAAVRFAIENGEWPLWNPFIQSGDPLAATMQAAPYTPWNLGSLLLPIESSFAFVVGMVLLSSVLSAFLFFRDLGLRELPALAGASCWAYCGFNFFWIQWPVGQVVCLFPLVLLAASRVAKAPGCRSFGLLLVALCMVLLSGHPESMFHVIVLGALWGAVELLRRRRSGWSRALGHSLAAGVLALGLCAFWLGPFLEALPQTTENILRREVLAKTERNRPAAESRLLFYPNIVPFVFGVYGVQDSTMLHPFTLPSTAYSGSLTFLPAAAGLLLSRRKVRFAFAAMIVGGVALGIELGPFAGWLAKLPLFDISLNERLVFLAALGVAGLTAIGLDVLAEHLEGGLKLRGFGPFVAIGLGVACCMGGVLAVLWPGMRGVGLTNGFLRDRAILYLLPPILILAALLSRRARVLVPSAFVVLLLVQRFAELGHLHLSFGKAMFYPPTELIKSLPVGGEPYRIVGLGTALLPNSSTMWRLEDIRGYQSVTFARLMESRRLLGAESAQMTFHPEKINFPFADFMNVRFAVVPRGTPPPAGWHETYAGPTAAVFENPKALSRANVPTSIRFGSHKGSLGWEMVRAERFDDRAWIQPWTLAAPRDQVTVENARGTVAVERVGTGYKHTTELDREGWVTFAETAWKGWHATIGEVELPLAHANLAFLGIRVPAGRQEVRLHYFPEGFRIGLIVSACSLASLIAVALFFKASKKRLGTPVKGVPR